MFDIHPLLGTQSCLRGPESTCMNDQTGCMYNDGHNACMHEADQGDREYDCPLKRKEHIDECQLKEVSKWLLEAKKRNNERFAKISEFAINEK